MEPATKQHNATQWVNEYSDLLYRFALRRVGESHTAKDLVQDTFLSAWKNIDTYRSGSSVKTWLFAILKNKVIDHYRKTSARVNRDVELDAAHDNQFFDSSDHWTSNAYPTTWEMNVHPVESKEFHVIFDGCRGKLKQIQNSVFSMKYLEGMSSEEICAVLELTSSNYWVLVHRAKLQLRACLEKNWFIR